jgi:hypothetical protein
VQNLLGVSLTNRNSDNKGFTLQYGGEKENSQKRLETSPKMSKNSPCSIQKEAKRTLQSFKPSATQPKDKMAHTQAKLEFTNASSIPISELAYTADEPCDIIQ